MTPNGWVMEWFIIGFTTLTPGLVFIPMTLQLVLAHVQFGNGDIRIFLVPKTWWYYWLRVFITWLSNQFKTQLLMVNFPYTSHFGAMFYHFLVTYGKTVFAENHPFIRLVPAINFHWWRSVPYLPMTLPVKPHFCVMFLLIQFIEDFPIQHSMGCPGLL